MKKFLFPSLLGATLLLATGLSAQTADATPAKPKSANELKARELLDQAKEKIMSIPSLIVEIEQPKACGMSSAKNFDKTGVLTLERPNKFRIERINGLEDEMNQLMAVSDGQKVSKMDDIGFVAFEKPVRAGSFFQGFNFMVQFFFDTKPIQFDPADPVWTRSVSLFDKRLSAYDNDTQLNYLGQRAMEDVLYDVVEIKYNTPGKDIRQHIYIDADKMIGQVDNYALGVVVYEKYRHFQTKFLTLGPGTFKASRPDKMPMVATDPARLGETTPDFKLPGAKGEQQITLKELLAKGKAVYICTLDGLAGRKMGPDFYKAQMRRVQQVKDKFEKQGLQVVVIIGGNLITPDLKEEMLLNWLPNLDRFNYPIAIDIDVERGIQGSAFQNFQVNGRNNLLLDKEGKVVFAANNMDGYGADRSNQLALYQALAEIGFNVSQADIDSAGRDEKDL